MATNPQSPMPQGGAPGKGGASQAPSSAPANPLQILLAQWFQTSKQIAQENGLIAPQMEKIASAIQEAQTAILMQTSRPAPNQTPPY